VRFKRTRKGIEATVDPFEAEVLAQCATELLDLLGVELDEGDADPLAALVGLPSGDVEAPQDPALQRLLPHAYGDDDPEASREFRRYTDADLRAGKRASAGTVLATLPLEGGKLLLDPEQAGAWLACLNDLRLVLGTRLEVTEQTDAEDYAPEDPRRHALQVYGWLGWLQETLVESLMWRRKTDRRGAV
jgi:hypothetical protein